MSGTSIFKSKLTTTLFLLAFVGLAACGDRGQTASSDSDPAAKAGTLVTSEVLVTSEAGDRIASKPNATFKPGRAEGTIIEIWPGQTKQTLLGIGSSFTESSAFVLAHLDEEARSEVMNRIFGEEGANFSLARTTVASTDFSVEGKYSYAPVADDAALEHFSIGVDTDGFRRAEYPGIQDESFDLLPMIQEALAIKADQADKSLRIVASAWTAPPWMKDIEDWYYRPPGEIGMEGTGGELKDEYVSTYADYLVKYLDAYAAAGVDIWGLTPVNEPHGNSGNWESMHFTPETQNEFIKSHLGPALEASGHGDVNVLIYDQNRDELEHWTDVILADPETAPYVYGTAVHWYASTVNVYEDTLERVHEKFPEFTIVNTEATIDNLGVPAPPGILDPDGYTESGWFGNDEWWWNDNATDWAYSASWAPKAEDHPIYTPVHRYARNIIVSLDHWMAGWIDWNVVLDRDGGPNHVGNFCGAPIMIDTASGEVYYTPVYYVLAQFSRTIRPGDTAVQTKRVLGELGDDDLHASAAVSPDGLLSVQLLNTTREAVRFSLQVGEQYADLEIPANAVQTVRVQLPSD